MLLRLAAMAAGCALALMMSAEMMIPRGPATTLSGTIVDAFQDEFENGH